MKEILFDSQPCFGNPYSYLDYIKKQYTKPNPLIRTILLLKLGDLEMVYPDPNPKPRKDHHETCHKKINR
jgi:hypothetical protein